PVGTPLLDIVGRRNAAGENLLGAIVNHRLVSLSTPLLGPARVQPLTVHDREGMQIYRRSISLVLVQAAFEVAPQARLRIGQSLGDAYFFEWIAATPLDAETVQLLSARMRALVTEDHPFDLERCDINEAIELFKAEGDEARVRLLKTRRDPLIQLVSLARGVHSICFNPVAPSTGSLTGFELAFYNDGLILRFPAPASSKHHEIHDMPGIFRVYRETRRFNELLGVGDVGQFNEVCISGGMGEIMKVAEAGHEKAIASIADQIVARDGVRLVLIAGPSSSGKTTFSKRLSLQLRVNGVQPVALSLDDYYVNRVDTPLDEDGKYDFETIEALDLPLLNDHLSRLLDGELVHTPRYDFTTGERVPKERWRPMRIGPNDLLVVEGIHGLNERLTSAIPADRKFRIYISALTQLTIDDHERIFTSDSRLIRRIVRDRVYRGYTAEKTIEMWPSVRRGEQRHIFPFQEQADAVFNSALVYEHAVLKNYAKRFLLEVPTDARAFVEAERLLRFLSLFVSIFPEEVPPTSLLREFIGGSSFSY
ncbi:MAG: cyclic nucleotide-binding protein, partial [Myxococcales bacterium]|nr:cyclic nucleotide-binding protein [Myxococcales bacterium]